MSVILKNMVHLKMVQSVHAKDLASECIVNTNGDWRVLEIHDEDTKKPYCGDDLIPYFARVVVVIDVPRRC